MMEFRTKINSDGRIALPAKCRQALHLSLGEEVIIRVKNEEATIFSVQHAIKHAQAIVKKHIKGKKSLVQEVIKMRREETKHE